MLSWIWLRRWKASRSGCASCARARTCRRPIWGDQVIAAAVAARADLIVSWDRKHLLPLGIHQAIIRDLTAQPSRLFVPMRLVAQLLG